MKKFKKSYPIVVIGDFILDSYIEGSSNRLSPEAPIPVLNVKKKYNKLGGALNVVNNLINLDQEVFPIGIIGVDQPGSTIVELLKKKINVKGILQLKKRRTTEKTRIIIQKQQIVRVDEEVTFQITDVEENKILKIFKNFVAKNDVKILILSDYNKGLVSDSLSKELINFCSKKEIKVLCDPKGKNYSKYSGSYLITPNKKEALEISDEMKFNKLDKIGELAKDLRECFNIKNILITLGKDGMFLSQENLKNELIPSKAREVFDVSGAGDTVIATIAASLNNKNNLINSCKISNKAAGIVVGKYGTASINNEELFSKNKNYLQLRDFLNSVKNDSINIVFTNGCFDIVHTGHIKLLKEAKKLGQILIVGLNSDRSVKELKGITRPINNQKDRKLILESIKYVDYVTIFDESTPKKLIEIVKPNFLVKGGDYKIKDIVGYNEVTSQGGQVKVIPLVKNKSTTSLINKIN